MKVIIAGSRSFQAEAADALVLSAVAKCPFEITEVVSGAARGIDSAGERWADANNVPMTRFRADWKRHGNGAGPTRNLKMADYADALIAIMRPGGSPGTRHMIWAMRQMKKPVFEVRG